MFKPYYPPEEIAYHEIRKKSWRDYNNRPEVKARRRLQNRTSEIKMKKLEYSKRPEVKARRLEYIKRPDVKAKKREYYFLNAILKLETRRAIVQEL